MAFGKTGKYYRSHHIARKMGDDPNEVEKKFDDAKGEDGHDGGKVTIEKTPGGYKSTHEDTGEEREHPDLQGALDHAKEAMGSGDDDMFASDNEPMSKPSKPSTALSGLNSLVG